MDNSQIKDLINELLFSLKHRYNEFTGIYFFGSRNSDKWNEESDLDLLFTFDKDLSGWEKREIRGFIYEQELKYNYLIDSHFYNLKDIINPRTPFRESILENAKYYAA